jgi:hypothetical protein
LPKLVVFARNDGPETLRKQRPALTTTRRNRAMAHLPLPDAEYLHKRLAYDPDTGRLLWKPVASKRWNSRLAGKAALDCICRYGYRVGRIDGRGVRSHRVIWKMMTGSDPAGEIDHINGDRSDNRWRNLRCVTHSGNMRNSRLPSDNTSGVIGVSWMAAKRKWRATVMGKHIGVFDTAEEAAAARERANVALSFHPNHGSTR